MSAVTVLVNGAARSIRRCGRTRCCRFSKNWLASNYPRKEKEFSSGGVALLLSQPTITHTILPEYLHRSCDAVHVYHRTHPHKHVYSTPLVSTNGTCLEINGSVWELKAFVGCSCRRGPSWTRIAMFHRPPPPPRTAAYAAMATAFLLVVLTNTKYLLLPRPSFQVRIVRTYRAGNSGQIPVIAGRAAADLPESVRVGRRGKCACISLRRSVQTANGNGAVVQLCSLCA